jgi:hypothetical protein
MNTVEKEIRAANIFYTKHDKTYCKTCGKESEEMTAWVAGYTCQDCYCEYLAILSELEKASINDK